MSDKWNRNRIRELVIKDLYNDYTSLHNTKFHAYLLAALDELDEVQDLNHDWEVSRNRSSKETSDMWTMHRSKLLDIEKVKPLVEKLYCTSRHSAVCAIKEEQEDCPVAMAYDLRNEILDLLNKKPEEKKEESTEGIDSYKKVFGIGNTI